MTDAFLPGWESFFDEFFGSPRAKVVRSAGVQTLTLISHDHEATAISMVQVHSSVKYFF